MRYLTILTAALFASLATGAGAQVRIKDIAGVQGARGNQLIGYGLITGLEGTGDGQSALFTPQSVSNMLERFGVHVPTSLIKLKNVAAVMITADLPPFAKNGSRIDVTVSSLGDAKSLQGGVLLQTPLRAADGEVYAVAQGPISIGGFNFSAGGSSVQKNHVNAGRIPLGAYVEKTVPTTLVELGVMNITLREPDFTTANRVAEAIRAKYPKMSVQATDAATVSVLVPPDEEKNIVGLVSKIEVLPVTPDRVARVVVNERTGTIVIGGDVRISAGSIANGSLNVKVENDPIVAIPPPFSDGKIVTIPQKTTEVVEKPAKLAGVPSTTTIGELVKALNALGVTPRDLITILQSMYRAGMLSAEIEIQ